MAWTYAADLENSAKDRVRFMIGDTDPDYAFLQDEEINYLIAKSGDELSAAVKAVRRIIAVLAKQVDYRIGPEQVKASGRLKHYKEVLAELESESKGVSHMKFSEPITHPPIFDIGMDDARPSYPSNWDYNPWTR